ncbi:MAG: hypothetical protein EU548_09910 [Promethearchaeota archaeon]|nr:MAG: hypothetical protein EU548_09910 [Candidatus Lokiarchaeota archaeon]
MFKKKSKIILEKFPEEDIIKKQVGANCFGQESKGLRQIRGNGVLILTDEELFFEYWVPEREIHIPIKSINAIEKTKWHLKKTKGRPLLKVNYFNDEGEEDSIAWWVNDVQEWVNVLERKILSS